MELIEQRFIDMYRKIGGLFGMNDLIIQIFAKLYIEPKEIAMDDLAEKTGYSLASISNSIKTLESMGLVRKSRKPGTKKIFLFMEKDFKKLVRDHLIKKQQYLISTVKEDLPEIIKDCKAQAKTESSKEKLSIMENYYKQILCMEKIIEKMSIDLEKM